jgi:hypothetical protein
MEIKRGYTVSYTERVALLCARGCVAYATCRGIDPAPAISRAESFRIGIGSVFPREDASRLPPRRRRRHRFGASVLPLRSFSTGGRGAA